MGRFTRHVRAYALCWERASELRNREKVLGATIDSRRDLRIRYTEPASSPPAGVTNLDQYRTSD